MKKNSGPGQCLLHKYHDLLLFTCKMNKNYDMPLCKFVCCVALRSRYGHCGMVSLTIQTVFAGLLKQAVHHSFVHMLSLVTFLINQRKGGIWP